jgi:hypothetical protein
LEDALKIEHFIGDRAATRVTRVQFQNNYWYNDDRVVKMKRIPSDKMEFHYSRVLDLYLKHQNMWEGGDENLEVEIEDTFSDDEPIEDEPES